jgi:hypothetical protein
LGSLPQDLALRIVEILKQPEPPSSGGADGQLKQPNQTSADPAELDADFLALEVDGAAEDSLGNETTAKATEAVKEEKSYRFTLITWLSYFWVGPDESNRGDNLVLRDDEKIVVAKAMAKALLEVEYQQMEEYPQSRWEPRFAATVATFAD